MIDAPPTVEGVATRPQTSPSDARRRGLLVGAGVAVLAAIPLVVAPTYLLVDLSRVGILATFGVSLALLMGGPHLVSLGHGGLLLAGAYAAALTSIHVTPEVWATLPLAAAAGALVALLMGLLAVRNSGVFFMMITLALGQLVFVVANDWDSVTGGVNGLGGIPAAEIGSFTFHTFWRIYALVAVITVVVFAVVGRVNASPFGQALRAIGANEERAAAVGYRTSAMKIAAFSLSGAIAGIAGALLTYLDDFVTPSIGHWSASAEGLLIVIVGGVGNLVGPLLGSGALFLLEDELEVHTEYAGLLTGVVFVLFVLFVPGGLVNLARRVWARVRR